MKQVITEKSRFSVFEATNVYIEGYKELISVRDLRKEIPFTYDSEITLKTGRQEIFDILDGKDNRFIIICGPCSIHDVGAALEYANKLKELTHLYSDKLLILMRVYFEKPRTSIGWKGLINDPDLNNNNDITKGLGIARKLLIDLANIGIYTATELLDPIVAAYIGQLVCWSAIGARTIESQTHRQMVSGLSAALGFKNSTDGSLDGALNAMKSSQNPHTFLGVNDDGQSSIVYTKGNPYGHIVLRGGGSKPNYHVEDIESTENKLRESDFPLNIMVDCSHGNSSKNHLKQSLVVRDIITQKTFYKNKSIIGCMLESNLYSGNQKLIDPEKLAYGVSITDKCIGWEDTTELISLLYRKL